jgi:hypothetical protein
MFPPFLRRSTVVWILLYGSLSGYAAGDQPNVQREADALRAAIPTAEVIVDDETTQQAGYVYKFSLDLPKGQRYGLALREFTAKDAPAKNLNYWELESERDEGPVLMTLRFNGLKDAPVGDGLLGQAKELGIRRECEGAHPRGVFTIVRVPMSDLPKTMKRQVLPATNKNPAAIAADGRRLLLILPAQSPDHVAVADVFPRAELVITKVLPKVRKPEPTQEIDPLVKLMSLWDRQRGLVGTAVIKYGMLRTGGDRLAPLTPEELNALLKQVGLGSAEPDLRTLARRISGSQTVAERPLGNMELIACGNKLRETYLGEARLTHLCDGEFVFQLRGGNPRGQLTVESRAGSRLGLTSLAELRYLPSSTIGLRAVATRMRDDKISLKIGESELIAELTFGFVERFTARDANGQVLREVMQFTSNLYKNEIVYPSAIVNAGYRNGNLNIFTLSVIDEVRFNEPLAADAFTLSVPAGTTVVDPRLDSFRPRVYMTDQKIDDAADYIRQRDERGNQ